MMWTHAWVCRVFVAQREGYNNTWINTYTPFVDLYAADDMHHMGLVNVLLPVLIVPLGQVATLFPDIYFCIIHGPDNLIC